MDQAIAGFQPRPNKPVRVQITEHLREKIGRGELVVGSKLPSTQQLAQAWQTQPATVHAALIPLVKEGLLDRSLRAGTFVAERSRTLKRVGIYLRRDIWCESFAAFARTLVSQLSEQLGEQGVETEILVDSRSREDRQTPWPELVRAVEQRRIQALLMPDAVTLERPWISRLPIPWVEWLTDPIRNRVAYSPGEQERLAVAEFVRMGCRTVGLISPDNRRLSESDDDRSGLVRTRVFHKYANKHGLQTQDDWMADPSQSPRVPEAESEQFGYKAMRRILAMPERPDGIFVTHDWVARGALMAVLESKVVVPDELKLVFFRNREINWMCPVPATFVEGSVAEVAQAMIGNMRAQLRGEEVEPVLQKLRIVSAEGYEISAEAAVPVAG